jgi:hypothetical protein
MIVIGVLMRNSEHTMSRVISDDHAEMRKGDRDGRKGWRNQKRQRRNHGDAYGIILSGGWRREMYIGKIVHTYL